MKLILHLFPGHNCEIEVDECLSDPCHNGATCVDHLNAFSCICQDGFEGIKKSTEQELCKPTQSFTPIFF